MKRKEKVIMSLLIIAIIFSITSIAMNIEVMNDIKTPKEQGSNPVGGLSVEVAPSKRVESNINEIG